MKTERVKSPSGEEAVSSETDRESTPAQKPAETGDEVVGRTDEPETADTAAVENRNSVSSGGGDTVGISVPGPGTSSPGNGVETDAGNALLRFSAPTPPLERAKPSGPVKTPPAPGTVPDTMGPNGGGKTELSNGAPILGEENGSGENREVFYTKQGAGLSAERLETDRNERPFAGSSQGLSNPKSGQAEEKLRSVLPVAVAPNREAILPDDDAEGQRISDKALEVASVPRVSAATETAGQKVGLRLPETEAGTPQTSSAENDDFGRLFTEQMTSTDGRARLVREAAELKTVSQVREPVLQAVRLGQNQVRVRLEPQGLGDVRIDLQVVGDRVHLRFSTESLAVRQVFEAGMPELRSQLNGHGLSLGDVSVEHQHDSDSRQHPGSGREQRQGFGRGGRPRRNFREFVA